MEKVRYPDLTYSKYAYDRRRRLVAGEPGIFKPQRRYGSIMPLGASDFNSALGALAAGGVVTEPGTKQSDPARGNPGAERLGAAFRLSGRLLTAPYFIQV